MVMLPLGIFSLALLCWPSSTAVGRLRLSCESTNPPKAPTLIWKSRRWLVWLVRAASASALAFVLGPGVTLGLGFLVVAIGHRVRANQRDKAAIANAFATAEALRTVVLELRAGAPLPLAIEAAAVDASSATSGILRNLMDFASLDEAVTVKKVGNSATRDQKQPRKASGTESANAKPSTAESSTRLGEQLANACSLTQRYGLPLAEIFSVVLRDLTMNIRFVQHTNAKMSGARASAAILAALPGVGLVLGQGMGAQPLHIMMNTIAGQFLAVLGCALIWLGLWWSVRLAKPGALR